MIEPRTWSIPPEPEYNVRLRDRSGTILRRIEPDHWETESGNAYGWEYLVGTYGPLTEVVETEVEAAARRLRESEFGKRGMVRLSRDYANAAQDIHVVLVHVLNGGVL